MSEKLTLTALAGIPAIHEGDDLVTILGDALDRLDAKPSSGDVLVVTHKIISKADGRIVDLRTVRASKAAEVLSEETGKPPAFCEVVLGESRRILKTRQGLIIAEHRLGMVMANAGIDRSNVTGDGDDQHVLLLPEDPDRCAAEFADALSARFGVKLAVIVGDSVGRAWRKGVVGLALGAANLPAVLDLRGRQDLDGRPLAVTEVGLADEITSAAELLMGEADEGRPVVLVSGLSFGGEAKPASALIRDPATDLFR